MPGKFHNFFEALKSKLLHRRARKSKHSDTMSFRVEGEPTFELLHKDGTITTWTLHNIVTQRASVLVQKLLMMQSSTAGITHIALGLGDPVGTPNNLNNGLPWPCDAPPAAPPTGGRTNQNGMPTLVTELARKKVDTKLYLNEDGSVSNQIMPDGTMNSVPTHIAVYKTLFLEHEGNGPIMEFALFGGRVLPGEIDYIPSFQTDADGVLLKVNNAYVPNTGNNRLTDPGDMVTFRTHKLFYKTSQDRLRVSYKLKIALNTDPPEPAAQ